MDRKILDMSDDPVEELDLETSHDDRISFDETDTCRPYESIEDELSDIEAELSDFDDELPEDILFEQLNDAEGG